jgi:Ion channel
MCASPWWSHLLSILEFIAGAVIAIIILWDTFETIVLPRTVRRRFRLTRLIFRVSWAILAGFLRLPIGRAGRDSALAFYGPLLLILLLVTWAGCLIVGFGLMLDSLSGISDSRTSASEDLGTAIYFSASTFFTLGLGDVVPDTAAPRALAALEAGTGFGFLALVIGYLPIFYQAFSRREVAISLLDARAGSPPTAIELIRRNGDRVAVELLAEWERWAAELLESHLSYPVLTLFRSQHEGQSWLGALTIILDTCALAMAGVEGMPDLICHRCSSPSRQILSRTDSTIAASSN